MNYSEAARLAKLFQSLADALYWQANPKLAEWEHRGHGYKVNTDEIRAHIDEA